MLISFKIPLVTFFSIIITYIDIYDIPMKRQGTYTVHWGLTTYTLFCLTSNIPNFLAIKYNVYGCRNWQYVFYIISGRGNNSYQNRVIRVAAMHAYSSGVLIVKICVML